MTRASIRSSQRGTDGAPAVRPPGPGLGERFAAASPLELRRNGAGVQVSLAPQDLEALVELTSSLSQGGSARAKVLWFDGTSWIDADTAELTVYDVIGTMQATSGKKALVRFHRQSGRWVVWQLQC
ncbi:MAG: hypothetical protein HYS13_01360 [Planctomycetia bacterium]|nr:hypothetical protein [Planctomycetia bacterium]